MKHYDQVLKIARVCHEANRAYCATLGDVSQLPWQDAPDWQRESAESGVRFHLETPGALASASHDKWMDEKLAAGWSYGKTKDAAAKTHHCLVPFDQLPREQQLKDVLFAAIVKALT